jgi:hypothetical protein
MPVQINEVVVRAIITGEDRNTQTSSSSSPTSETIAQVTKDELLELIDEVINDKKER